MRTIGIHTRIASFVGAVALLIQISPVLAADGDHDDNRPVEITFTKWAAPPPAVPPTPFFGLFEGFAGDGLLGSFGAELLWRQASVNGHVAGLEAMYEVVDGDRSFTALIRGGSNPAGLGLLDGVILAGWRTGARVHVRFQRYLPSEGGCVGAPVAKNCFEGIIYVGPSQGPECAAGANATRLIPLLVAGLRT
jgi:hypothetical protein